MVCVLVPVQSDDIHAKAVRRALAYKGHEAVLLYGGDLSTRAHASIFLSEEGVSWAFSSQPLNLLDKKFEVVWFRRPAAPVFPGDMPVGDKEVAHREWQAFNRGFWGLVAPYAFWVNSLEGRSRALSKPIQLSKAMEVGLRIPPTLFGNDPSDIRKFISKYPGEVVYKSFFPTAWESETEVARLFTSQVGLEDLPDDAALGLCPGIFQKRIEKAYELRVTYMGDYSISARLLSQEHPSSQLDWRASRENVKVIPDELPDEIDCRCLQLMKELGIVFGCFDFIVTPRGDYIFLEVNEMGQFLWLEEDCPDLLLLDSFSNFIIQGGLEKNWNPSGDRLRFADFKYDLPSEIEEIESHVRTPHYNVFPDAEKSSCR